MPRESELHKEGLLGDFEWTITRMGYGSNSFCAEGVWHTMAMAKKAKL
jgi:hypothetical protein